MYEVNREDDDNSKLKFYLTVKCALMSFEG